MTTPAKRWPNNAEWARLDCIALSRTGRAAIMGIIDQTHDIKTVRAIVKAADCFREIEMKLMQAKGDINE